MREGLEGEAARKEREGKREKERTGVADKDFERAGRLSVKTDIRRISPRYRNHPHFPSGARA